MIGLGAPAALLLLREQSTISPARLLAAVVRWRARPALLAAPSDRAAACAAARCGSTGPPPDAREQLVDVDELPWLATPSREAAR